MANPINAEVLSGGYRTYNPSAGTKKTSDLNKDTFLKLLITQMQNQDPLNPMEDREFIAQMAQFTSLEQMQNLNENLNTTQEGIMDRITQMNNNLVKSQTTIAKSLDDIGILMKLMAEKTGVVIPKPTEPENKEEAGQAGQGTEVENQE